ncbi:BREX-1 system adenine-specific DNA-methyltransferase PglX [Marinobacter segnicrescens]|uniref:BREX-1 system adenine-specific DNA-methyltransferase PglX n=1 Tax=Marinobacter segnicrescens TaxID=430453 RepID=UPI003A9154DB
MNTNNVKNYAPKARTAFIAAMTKRAALFGIRESSIPSMGIEPLEQKGDLALIGDRAFPASIIRPRAALVKKVEQLGFAQAMEQAAYSWFNRLCAIRYMELKDYLDHGRRVLSAADGSAGTPQILEDCLEIDLPGLDKQLITELKLDGNKDEELYRELLLAQCHALHQAMPFLFEAVDDSTELLLPDNLTKTDSLIRELVSAIPEEDWANIEIIGWLYQFYISEKKDQVIGKVVKSADIPAATQLFTPNWIVKYMVQNSLGAQWLATYPDSPLKAQMEYYIEPAEQTDEVKAQLAAITPENLNPEELTLIDPASGSGHILVEAYDLFKAIYLERGYRQRDVAQLILQKNLFGLDIDERAAQLTGFALMMKGRADDRRLFERGVKLNVMALENSTGFDAEALANGVKLSDYGLQLGDLTELKRLFEHAATFGSLIQVPEDVAKKLPALKQLSKAASQDLFVADELKHLEPLVQQAEVLVAQYDAVVANPPYMAAKAFPVVLKDWLRSAYRGNEKDLFSAFIARMLTLANQSGYAGVMTSFVWMFITTFDQLRKAIVSQHTINSLVQLHYDAFADAKAHVCTFVLQKKKISGQKSAFVRLSDFPGVENQGPKTLQAIRQRDCGWFYETSQDEFARIPGSPIAYWIRNAQPFDGPRIGDEFESGGRTKTHDNEKYLRFWWEVDRFSYVWTPFANGGDFRKFVGNDLQVVDWSPHATASYESHGGLYPEKYWGKEGITWGLITSARVSFRVKAANAHYSSGAPTIYPGSFSCDPVVLGFLNSPIAHSYLKAMNPTVNTTVNDVLGLPLAQRSKFPAIEVNVRELISLGKGDWNAYERSWDFQYIPLLAAASEPTSTLESSYTAWITQSRATIAEMQRLEEENNRLFIDAYGLADELTPDVPIEQITLTVNPAYRYGGKLSEAELWTRFRENSMQELVSYAIGCMLGRYSLDEPGLIYAHSGNEGFDPSRYTNFPADADGILPLTDKEWFADDAANRLIEFVSVAWDKTDLEANLRFLADNLSPKKAESSRDTLRRYLCENFFKDHLQTYKKRPIYWLFSSGKHKAFQCLVYLHRYHEGTLARMRTEYVIPLTAKLNTYANKLEQDIEASTSTAEKKRLEKELAALHNQQAELATFDEKLRHYADQRISLDLDDGVKMNYGKFGDLLAEVKAVTGDKSSDA